MLAKVAVILGSVRFWIILLTAALAILNGAPLIETIQTALAAVVVIGSADSVASRIAGK